MFQRSKQPIQDPESEGVRILLDFKLTGETVSKIAIAVISAAVVGLVTTTIIQATKSPTLPPAETVRPLK